MLQIGHNLYFHFNDRVAYGIINGWKILQFQGLRIWRWIFNLDCSRRSLRSSRFFFFSRQGSNTRAKKRASEGPRLAREQNIGRSGETVSEKGERMEAEKRNRLQSIADVLLNSVRP